MTELFSLGLFGSVFGLWLIMPRVTYRYHASHKDELERQCTTMLEQGLIQRSTSAFSPVLLVKKADVTWCFCVDYRALNAITVKVPTPFQWSTSSWMS